MLPVQTQSLDKVICDCCKKEYDFSDIYSKDSFQIQEFHHIAFVAGYESVFGDGSKVECDLCQNCLKKLLGKYLRITKGASNE